MEMQPASKVAHWGQTAFPLDWSQVQISYKMKPQQKVAFLKILFLSSITNTNLKHSSSHTIFLFLKSIPYRLIIETYFFNVDLSQAEMSRELKCNHLDSNYICKIHLHWTLKISLINNKSFCYAKCSNPEVWIPAAAEMNILQDFLPLSHPPQCLVQSLWFRVQKHT